LPSDISGRSLNRTIIEEESFVEEATRIEPDDRRRDEWLDWVKYQLSWVPEMYRPIGDRGLWVADVMISPPVRIIYRFDDNTVTLLGIERLDEQS
jgi:hypothetical protein